MNEPNNTLEYYNMNCNPRNNRRREDDHSPVDSSSRESFDQFRRVHSVEHPINADLSPTVGTAIANSEFLPPHKISSSVDTDKLKSTGIFEDCKPSAAPALVGSVANAAFTNAVAGTVNNDYWPFANSSLGSNPGNTHGSSASAFPSAFGSWPLSAASNPTNIPLINLQEYKNSDKTFCGKGSFPMNLCLMLESVDSDNLAHVISWMPCGRAFVIHDKDCLLEVVLPKYFKSSRNTKIRSFGRKLNRWGFTISRTGPTKGAWEHPTFNRGLAAECLKKALVTGDTDCFNQLSINHVAVQSSLTSAKSESSQKRRESHSSSMNDGMSPAGGIRKASTLTAESDGSCLDFEDNNEDFLFPAAPQPLPALPLPPTQTSYVGQDAFHHVNQMQPVECVAFNPSGPDWNCASLPGLYQNSSSSQVSSSFTSGATRMQGNPRRGVTRASWTAGTTSSYNRMDLMPSRCFFPLNAGDASNVCLEEEELNEEPLAAVGGEEDDNGPLSQEDLELRAFFERFAQSMD